MTDTTDFNDLAAAAGLPAVAEQVNQALMRMRQGNSPAPSGSEYGSGEPPAPSGFASISADGVEYDEDRRYSLATLHRHFFYIYGTKECWDNIRRERMDLTHLGHLVGREKYKKWMESANRKTVLGLKFEPGADLGPDYVNLFEGWGVEPKSGACDLILKHLSFLCRHREEQFQWLLRWLAYPLQNPGAKMASAVIVYGSEGPGKSITFDNIMGRIYGRHKITIGQAQLESTFTEWQSRRLFAVAEEVVSRQERNHHKGMLKHLVTGSTLQIDQKHLSLREETNHLNFVFLSNSTVPLELDMGDRRYLVLYVDEVPKPEYFQQLFQQIDNGGVEAFFHHLINLDLSGFDEHSKPPMTEEKGDLIGASMTSPQYFHYQWRNGELDIPYMCATAADLYRYFTNWCEQNGEFKRTQRYFGQELQRVMKPARLRFGYPEWNSVEGQHRVYVAEPCMAMDFGTDSPAQFIGRRCRLFREGLKQEGIIRE